MTPLRLEYPVSVAILYTTEDETTVGSMEQINVALTKRGHMVRIFEVTKKNWKKALRVSGDVVINMIEDESTEWKLWAKVAKELEMLGRAQLGIGMESIRYGGNKNIMKKKLLSHGLSTPKFRLIKEGTTPKLRLVEFPLIIKPAGQHASVGISQDSVVIDQKELVDRVKFLDQKLPGDVIAEEFIEGREFHITVIGNGKHVVSMPYTEIEFKGEYLDNWNVYSHNAKWNDSSWEFWNSRNACPAILKRKVFKVVDELVVKAFRVLQCRDICRFDVRMNDKGIPHIIDLNVCPDLSYNDETETWRSAKALDWSYAEFIETLVAITYKRHYKRLPNKMRERNFLLTARAGII